MPKPPSNHELQPQQLFLGIDPGASGGLAYYLRDMWAEPMPATESDIWYFFDGHRTAAFAVIEKVGGYVAGNPTPGSAMFKFGRSYGGLRMALVAARIGFEEVTPQKWQKEMGLIRAKSEDNTRWKNRLKQKAQQLFPTANVTLKTADAILIAEYCRRVHG